MKDIRLTLVQMRSTVGDIRSNLDRMASFISSTDSDIICFPEMCLSGYTTSAPDAYALDPEDPAVSRVRDLSDETDTAIVFGFMERNPSGRPFLRQEVTGCSSNIGHYKKTHLGQNESKVFQPGDSLPVFSVKGITLGLQLCIESHIPDISQSYRSKGAELILMPFANGNSGDRRRSVWYSYLPARASDNGLFVAATSAVGDNGLGTVFGGGMIVLGPKGNTIGEYYGTDEHSITVDIGGELPRDGPETMSNISYFDRRRPELY